MEFTVVNDDFARQAGRNFADQYQRMRMSCSSPDSGADTPGIWNDTLNSNKPANADHVATQLTEWASKGASVVAHENGKLRGYMVGRFIDFLHDSKAFYIPEWGHCTTAENPDRLIRQMYAWLTRSGKIDGSTVHMVTTFSSDRAAFDALSSTGFGVHHMDALKFIEPNPENKTSPVPATPPFSVRGATPSDLDQITNLDNQLLDHLSKPPISLPIDLRKSPKYRLPDPNAHIPVAEVNGRLIGFMSCRLGIQEPAGLNNPLIPHINGAFVEPEHREGAIATALLNNIVAWARNASANRVTVDFETANAEGAGFWLGSGFIPTQTTLVRRASG